MALRSTIRVGRPPRARPMPKPATADARANRGMAVCAAISPAFPAAISAKESSSTRR
ncbi:hypothetical protein [Streptomyces sp. NPDC048442]|uniref:hypothetical protein n=1 Tax=Streptomyces sp. NPDC048442 TaxID=3154823 RepID=UPI00342326E7